MIPPLIVRRAVELGLGLMAVTDHNACANCAAVMQAAEGTGLVVLPGMEVQTAEEVHIFVDRKGCVEVLPQSLGDVGDLGTDVQPVGAGAHVAAEHMNVAFLDLLLAGDHSQQRRFSHAVGADETDPATGRDLEVDSFQGVLFLVPVLEPLDPYD